MTTSMKAMSTIKKSIMALNIGLLLCICPENPSLSKVYFNNFITDVQTYKHKLDKSFAFRI